MSEKLTCPICGEPTRVYMGNARKDRLCGKHADELKSGKIEIVDLEELNILNWEYNVFQNKATKEFLNKNTSEIPNELKKNEKNNVIVINENNRSRCITCGKQTNGLLFCGTCYKKYKEKKLLFEITNCSNVELLDDSYEGKYICSDGHIVKSKSEREIDNFLYKEGIAHAYEKTLSYGRSEKEVIHPDFCLKDYLGKGKDVYLEHWGYNENNINYTNTKKFKLEIYKKMGVTLICTNEKGDMRDIEANLNRKLNKSNIKENEIND